VTAVAAGSGQISKPPILADTLCLAGIALASAVPYVARLGFYSDDWALLEEFSANGNGSLAEIAGSGFAGRPVQALYSAALFKLFGLRPLGYHLVDTAVLAACAALLYLLLVRLRFSRVESFATTLLFLMLPQLSTVRVWFAAFQVPLSMALMLVSMHWQLTFARFGRIAALAGAVAAALLSIGAYEIFGPLLAAFAVGLLIQRWRNAQRPIGWRNFVIASLIAALTISAFVYKLLVSGRAGAVGDPARYVKGLRQLFRVDYDWRADSGLNILATPRAHFWAPVEGWWSGAKMLLGGGAGAEVIVIALLLAAIAAWRLAGASEPERSPARLLLLGIGTFALGNSIFLVVPSVAFTSTGMDNRVQVAAAIGVAMIFAALILFVARALPFPRRAAAFSATTAIVAAAAFARLAAIEAYWAQAPALQAQVLGAAQTDLRGLPTNSTVILDGVCPYHGPAVIFETYWDLEGALSLALGRPLHADVVSSRMSLTRGGLATSIYKEPRFYPYGPSLYAYNPMKHQLVQLGDAAAAAHYFDSREQRTCGGYVARGVEV
jgi:hypothetical protein